MSGPAPKSKNSKANLSFRTKCQSFQATYIGGFDSLFILEYSLDHFLLFPPSSNQATRNVSTSQKQTKRTNLNENEPDAEKRKADGGAGDDEDSGTDREPKRPRDLSLQPAQASHQPHETPQTTKTMHAGEDEVVTRGVFVGDSLDCFSRACDLSLQVNVTMLDRPLGKVLVFFL